MLADVRLVAVLVALSACSASFTDTDAILVRRMLEDHAPKVRVGGGSFAYQQPCEGGHVDIEGSAVMTEPMHYILDATMAVSCGIQADDGPMQITASSLLVHSNATTEEDVFASATYTIDGPFDWEVSGTRDSCDIQLEISTTVANGPPFSFQCDDTTYVGSICGWPIRVHCSGSGFFCCREF